MKKINFIVLSLIKKILEENKMGELLGSLDDQIIIFLQSFSPQLDLLFGIITQLSDEE